MFLAQQQLGLFFFLLCPIQAAEKASCYELLSPVKIFLKKSRVARILTSLHAGFYSMTDVSNVKKKKGEQKKMV